MYLLSAVQVESLPGTLGIRQHDIKIASLFYLAVSTELKKRRGTSEREMGEEKKEAGTPYPVTLCNSL